MIERMKIAYQLCDDSFITGPLGENFTDLTKFIDVVRDSGLALNDSMSYCKWHNDVTECESLYKQNVAEEGLCYTFNVLNSEQIYTDVYVTQFSFQIFWFPLIFCPNILFFFKFYKQKKIAKKFSISPDLLTVNTHTLTDGIRKLAIKTLALTTTTRIRIVSLVQDLELDCSVYFVSVTKILILIVVVKFKVSKFFCTTQQSNLNCRNTIFGFHYYKRSWYRSSRKWLSPLIPWSITHQSVVNVSSIENTTQLRNGMPVQLHYNKMRLR